MENLIVTVTNLSKSFLLDLEVPEADDVTEGLNRV